MEDSGKGERDDRDGYTAPQNPANLSHLMPQRLVPSSVRTADVLGQLPAPMTLAALRATPWDAIIVGAGHNGLTCAAYLAQAGLRVLVLEARDRVGGACTLEEPWPGYRMSPCAYLCGLLHPTVIRDLQLVERGLRWHPAEAGLFVPFDDGTAVQLWEDEARCLAEIERFAPADVAGWQAMGEVMQRLRDAIRPDGLGDLWLDVAPSRQVINDRLKGDDEAHKLLFEWSMVEYAERYLTDERLISAVLGQGVIGTNASPHDPGTASINFHHSSGRMFGQTGTWGYVEGGIGMVSFLLCDAAREAGAVVVCQTPVARIEPGRGVRLDDGTFIGAPVVVANADPRTTVDLLGEHADAGWEAAVTRVPMTGCTVKVNVILPELPNFHARPGRSAVHHRGQINTPLDRAAWQTAFDTAQRGELPEHLWTELYFQTAEDASLTPNGEHLMSIFAQYVPHTFAKGTWDSRRDEVGRLAIDSVARFADLEPIKMTVSGPPDIHEHVGLHGGHIFQGSCLPPYMWDQRLGYRTPMPGLYLCGAATHPGGSVIAINGRNAAQVVLQDRARGAT